MKLKGVHPLVFFGFYCLLIGYMIVRSTFLPRILGVLTLWLLVRGVDAPRWMEQASAASVSLPPP
jgi:hypothetical protein